MKPNVLCITGGMGSGKSLALKVLSELGWPIYPADERAKFLVTQSLDLQSKLKEEFGPDAIDSKGQPNPLVLGTRGFANREAWNKLNSIIHPAVQQDFLDWLNEEPQCRAHWVARESALLFEVGAANHCSKILLITSLEPIRKQRIAARQPDRNAEELYRRMSFQWNDDLKIEQLREGDFHVTNDGSPDEFVQKIKTMVESRFNE